MRKKSLKIPKG